MVMISPSPPPPLPPQMQYAKTSNSRMCTRLDFPPVSSAIIWARQIDRQLQTYLQRVEAVLGKGWENHVEGQKLKQDGEAFRAKLNTQQLFEDWRKNVEGKTHVVQGRIFVIASQRTRTGTILRLQVNFSSDSITLAKEVGGCGDGSLDGCKVTSNSRSLYGRKATCIQCTTLVFMDIKL